MNILFDSERDLITVVITTVIATAVATTETATPTVMVCDNKRKPIADALAITFIRVMK